ncbi:hypothetical protein DM877_23310, partial [Enterobacter cloacae]
YWCYDRHRSVRLVVLVGLANDQIAQSGLSSLSVIYYSAQLFRAPFHSEGGDNRNNIIVKLSEAALDNLDRVGYELVKKYRLAGYTQERIRMVALSHLIEAA